jgi:hypothetical protein
MARFAGACPEGAADHLHYRCYATQWEEEPEEIGGFGLNAKRHAIKSSKLSTARGTTRVVLTGNDKLEGDYCTGRDRNNTGVIRLGRKS